MTDINYAALDADDDSNVSEVKSHRAAVARPRRKALSAEEKLKKALADVASLQEKVVALRTENRESAIEELFRRFEIDEIEGDLSETKRCDALLSKF